MMKKSTIVVLSLLIICIVVGGFLFVNSGYPEFALHSAPWMQFDTITVSPYYDYATNHDYFFMVGFSAINPSSTEHELFINTAQLTIPGYVLTLPSWEGLGSSYMMASCAAYYLFISFDATGSSPQTMPANGTTQTVTFTLNYSLDSSPQTYTYSNAVPIMQFTSSTENVTASQPSGPPADICQMHTQAVYLTTIVVLIPLGILVTYCVLRARKQKQDSENGDKRSS